MQIGYTVNVNLFRGALMVKIITDSASDFELNELKELMIDCIPLSVNFGDEEYKDNVTISKDEFFDKLKNTTETVKTSQPSLHDIAEEFEATGTSLYLYNSKTKKIKDLTDFAFMNAMDRTKFIQGLKKEIAAFK